MSEKYGYAFAAIASSDRYVVTGAEWELEDKDVPHAIVFEFANGKWSAWSLQFRVAATALGGGLFFAVGEDGEVEVTAADNAWDEVIDTTAEGPSSVRPINGVEVIGDHVYAVGMRRQVYRRKLDTRTWERADQGCRVAHATRPFVGFNAVDGEGPDDLYAVGLVGEIWHCVSGKWTQLDSPTNIPLDVVTRLASGSVLAGGALGTLVRVNGPSVSLIRHEATNAGITGIAEFAGRVFVSVETGSLFELRDDQLVSVEVPFPSSEGGGELASSRDRLLFVRSDSVVLFDGKEWSDATPPDDA